ncbi:MAG: dihydrofolate reductase family protein [Kineosporiaceae bacterium]
MHLVTYTMGMSIDGYVMGPDGGFDFTEPQPEVFAHHTDELRRTSVHLLGRRLYETMRYWEDPEVEATFGDAEWEWARLWRALPKVVFSRTLTSVEGTATRLATGTLAEEIARLRTEPGDGDIAIGGAELAAAAAAEDLIDEYRPLLHSVLVGGGTPFFAQAGRRVPLEFVDSRAFAEKVVAMRYRVVR